MNRMRAQGADMPGTSPLTIDDISVGQEASFRTIIDGASVDQFATLTGDNSRLHMDSEFAASRGFDRRVVHGALLAGYVSRLVGVVLPGQNCLLQSIRLNFLNPAYIGDEIEVAANVVQISHAVNVMIAGVTITRVATNERLATGQVQIGFTTEQGMRAATTASANDPI